MTNEEIKVRIEIMQAFLDGKAVQRRNPKDEDEDEEDVWTNDLNPNFHPVWEWRIKPELMEFYAIASDDKTDILSGTFKTENEAAEYLGRQGWANYTKIVHLVEKI